MHLDNDVFLAWFSDASGNIGGAAGGLRRMRECHTVSSRPPRAAPYYQRILYNNKRRQGSLRDLARLEPMARRISIWLTSPVFKHILSVFGIFQVFLGTKNYCKEIVLYEFFLPRHKPYF